MTKSNLSADDRCGALTASCGVVGRGLLGLFALATTWLLLAATAGRSTKSGSVRRQRRRELGADIDARPKRTEFKLVELKADLAAEMPDASPEQLDAAGRQALRDQLDANAPARGAQTTRRKARKAAREAEHLDHVVMIAAVFRHPLWRELMSELCVYRGGRRSTKRMVGALWSCLALRHGMPRLRWHYQDLMHDCRAVQWALEYPADDRWATVDPGSVGSSRVSRCGKSESAVRVTLLGSNEDGIRDPDTGYRRGSTRRLGAVERLPLDLHQRLLVRAAEEYATKLGLRELAGAYVIDGVKVEGPQEQRASISDEDEALLRGQLEGSGFGYHGEGSRGWRGYTLLLLTWVPPDDLPGARPVTLGYRLVPANQREHEEIIELVDEVYRLWRDECEMPLLIEYLIGDSAYDIHELCATLELSYGCHPVMALRRDAGPLAGVPCCVTPGCARRGMPMEYVIGDTIDSRKRLGLHDASDGRRQPLQLNLDKVDFPDDEPRPQLQLADYTLTFARLPDGTVDPCFTLAPGQSIEELLVRHLINDRARIVYQCKDVQESENLVVPGCHARQTRKIRDNPRRHLFLPAAGLHKRYQQRLRPLSQRNIAESTNSRLEQFGYPLPGTAKPGWVKVDAVARGLVGSRLLALLLADIAELDGTYTMIRREADELGINQPHRPKDEEFAAAARRYRDAVTLLQ